MPVNIHVRTYMYVVHGKYVYSTLALEKEREIVKEETALRKEKEAVCCYVHVDVPVCVHVPQSLWTQHSFLVSEDTYVCHI